MFWDLSLKSAERVHTAQMARPRQLRSYSRDCFAPSQETTGEHHAYDLVYLQNVDLGKFSTRARSISPSLRALALQLNTSHSLQQVSNQTQQREITTTMPHEKHYNEVIQMSRHDWNNKVSLIFLARQPTSSSHEAMLPIQTQGKTSSVTIQVSWKWISLNSAENSPILNYHLAKANDRRRRDNMNNEWPLASSCNS
jgi:hypothetical protein